MLRLEKKSRRGDINLSFRHRERFLNRLLLQAFGLAFAWHAAAFLIFHVGGFKIFDGESVITPIAVNADIQFDSQEDSILAQALIDEEQRRDLHALPPPSSEPSIPEMIVAAPSLSFPFFSIEDWNRNPFASIENDIQDQYFDALETRSAPPPIQILVSGALAARLIPEGIADIEKKYLLIPSESQRWIFTVQVQDEVGSIFWHQPHDPLSPQNKNLARQILNALKFVPDQNGFVSTGEVEIVLNGGSRD